MKLIARFSPVLAVLVLAMACGDDDDDTSPTNTQCKSPYTDRTEAKLKEQTRAGAGCADDSATVCGNDVITLTSSCGQSCFPMFPDDATKRAACTGECLQGMLSPKLSDSCLTCYLQSVDCTAKFCLAECLSAGASGPQCVTCRLDNNCTANFYACSGLPIPTTSSGGTSSGGARSGGSAGKATGGTVGMGGDAGAAGMGEAGMSSAGMSAGGGGAGGMGSGATSGLPGGGADSGASAGGNSGAGGN